MKGQTNPELYFFPIGTKYVSRGKHPNVCTITDIYRTYDNNNDLIKTAYVAVHDFMGQTVTDYDVPKATVTMGIARMIELEL